MQLGVLTVGTSAVEVPVVRTPALAHGLRVLGRAAAAGKVFVGLTGEVTAATGALLACGDPATSAPFTVPPDHFAAGGRVWLVASEAGQTVDWAAN